MYVYMYIKYLKDKQNTDCLWRGDLDGKAKVELGRDFVYFCTFWTCYSVNKLVNVNRKKINDPDVKHILNNKRSLTPGKNTV